MPTFRTAMYACHSEIAHPRHIMVTYKTCLNLRLHVPVPHPSETNLSAMLSSLRGGEPVASRKLRSHNVTRMGDTALTRAHAARLPVRI